MEAAIAPASVTLLYFSASSLTTMGWGKGNGVDILGGMVVLVAVTVDRAVGLAFASLDLPTTPIPLVRVVEPAGVNRSEVSVTSEHGSEG